VKQLHNRPEGDVSMNAPTTPTGLALRAATASDLMTPNPVSIRQQATLLEAAALLTDREISAVPVINNAGHAVGVLSRADIVRHNREAPALVCSSPAINSELEKLFEEESSEGFHVETPDRTTVREIMTPVVISVKPEDTALDVVVKMLAMKIHHVYVIDGSGVLVGVISTFDILRNLHRKDDQ
jgi:CBS domain-containing protein